MITLKAYYIKIEETNRSRYTITDDRGALVLETKALDGSHKAPKKDPDHWAIWEILQLGRIDALINVPEGFRLEFIKLNPVEDDLVELEISGTDWSEGPTVRFSLLCPFCSEEFDITGRRYHEDEATIELDDVPVDVCGHFSDTGDEAGQVVFRGREIELVVDKRPINPLGDVAPVEFEGDNDSEGVQSFRPDPDRVLITQEAKIRVEKDLDFAEEFVRHMEDLLRDEKREDNIVRFTASRKMVEKRIVVHKRQIETFETIIRENKEVE